MLPPLLRQLTALDWLAFFWFISCWAGYGRYAEGGERARHGLVGLGHSHRLAWARRLIEREVRIVDASLIGNLMSSVSFYANTTIYIIAGIFAVLGTLDKWVTVAADLPFGHAASSDLLEMKLLLLSATFIFAYFKLTWSLRQFNLLSILVGAAPTGSIEDAGNERYAQKIAAVNTDAGDEFNRGIRAYYFGVAALTWIINPGLFIALTTAIIIVLYRRDFASSTRRAMDD